MVQLSTSRLTQLRAGTLQLMDGAEVYLSYNDIADIEPGEAGMGGGLRDLLNEIICYKPYCFLKT